MAHSRALEAHEHRNHAEHAVHQNDPLVSQISITVAILAVMAASVGSLEAVEAGGAITAASEAALFQDHATDLWSQYQADSLKVHIYGIAADPGGANAARYAATAKQHADEQAGIRRRAQEDEAERDKLMAASRAHEHRHHWLTGAATLLEIGIAISTVAIVTRQRPFWLGSIMLGAAGIGLSLAAYLL